jgi:hypothetical protein
LFRDEGIGIEDDIVAMLLRALEAGYGYADRKPRLGAVVRGNG